MSSTSYLMTTLTCIHHCLMLIHILCHMLNSILARVCVHACVRTCVCVCVFQSTQLYKWSLVSIGEAVHGGLVSTGEVAHTAVASSVGTWCQPGSKFQLFMPCITGECPGGTLNSHTLICEAWYGPYGILMGDLPMLT